MKSSIYFKREKVSSLMGYTEVRFTEESSVRDEATRAFVVVADSCGVRCEGNSPHFMDVPDLDVFAKAISEAWMAHLSLKPKLTSTLSGH